MILQAHPATNGTSTYIEKGFDGLRCTRYRHFHTCTRAWICFGVGSWSAIRRQCGALRLAGSGVPL